MRGLGKPQVRVRHTQSRRGNPNLQGGGFRPNHKKHGASKTREGQNNL